MASLLFRIKLIVIAILFSVSAFAQEIYTTIDSIPDVNDPEIKELIEILNSHPNTPLGSTLLDVLAPSYKDGQKFRPDWGNMAIRGLLCKNCIQILAIGQDATHIAEFANRPGIAGFGGRVHDMASHFGVFEQIFFTNLFTNTISGQYGSRSTPVIEVKEDGRKFFTNLSVTENRLWSLAHDSPYSEFRNKLLAWVMKRNQDSLKMVLMLGQAGKDAGGSFYEYIGGKIDGYISDEDARRYLVPEFEMVGAGGNNEAAIPLTKDGKSLYSVLHKMHRGRWKEFSMKNSSDVKLAQQLLKDHWKDALDLVAINYSGPMNNGIMRAEQLGGFNWESAESRRLKGMRIPDGKGGSFAAPDVLFLDSPHPTYLSIVKTDGGDPSKIVNEGLVADAKSWVRKGWKAPRAEKGGKSNFERGKPYQYGRASVPLSHGDLGTPDIRLTPVSSAVRFDQSVIIGGERDKNIFGSNGKSELKRILDRMKKDDRHDALPNNWMVRTGRPLYDEWKYEFDQGLPADVERVFRRYLPDASEDSTETREIFSQTHRDTGYFGHYRGTLDDPEVFVLADPHGWDDIMTSRALTGERGQYLHGIFRDLGIDDKYFVLKTLPVGMDGASEAEWNDALYATRTYREKVIEKVLETTRPKVFVADGEYAAKELERILDELEVKSPKIVTIERGNSASSGIKSGGSALKSKLGSRYRRRNISGDRADIPRSHLTFVARVWEGTSGDRVISGRGKYQGKAFAAVAPNWAAKFEGEFSRSEERGWERVLAEHEEMGFRSPEESVAQYFERRRQEVERRERAFYAGLRERSAESALEVVRTEVPGLEMVGSSAGSCEANFYRLAQ